MSKEVRGSRKHSEEAIWRAQDYDVWYDGHDEETTTTTL